MFMVPPPQLKVICSFPLQGILACHFKNNFQLSPLIGSVIENMIKWHC